MTRTDSKAKVSIKVAVKRSKKRVLSAETKYYILQKTVGIAAFLAGIFGGIAVESIAPLLVLSPMGIGLFFTKEKVLMISNVYWDENPISEEKDKTYGHNPDSRKSTFRR